MRPWHQSASQGLNFIQLDAFPSTFEYQIKLSDRRKTLSLEVANQSVLVRAPQSTPQYLIDNFLIERQYWLLDKLTKQSHLPQNEMAFEDKDGFYYLGDKYTLRIIHGNRFSYQLNHEKQTLTFIIPLKLKDQQNYIKNKFKSFLFEQAEEVIRYRFQHLESELDLYAKQLEFKIYKRRWGCCYQSGLIRINPLLISAPEWVIDCVLIHELCHLKHLNHSRQFWQLNAQFCSNCEATKQWLQIHNHALQVV